MEDYGSDSGSDNDEEAPQIVVVKTGDLTAEEAEAEKKRIDKGQRIHSKSWRNLFVNPIHFC